MLNNLITHIQFINQNKKKEREEKLPVVCSFRFFAYLISHFLYRFHQGFSRLHVVSDNAQFFDLFHFFHGIHRHWYFDILISLVPYDQVSERKIGMILHNVPAKILHFLRC